MAIAEQKTKANNASVDKFINSVENTSQRNDTIILNNLMQKVTGQKPVMWGSSLIGYGKEKLKYSTGRELDWLIIGFSPRKQNLSLYVLRSGEDKYSELLTKLGPHKTGKGCLYIKSLSDININILEKILIKAFKTKF